MPRKDSSLCRYRGCHKKRWGRALYCSTHAKKRKEADIVLLKAGDVKLIADLSEKIVDWTIDSCDYIQDMVDVVRDLLRKFQFDMQDAHARECWTLTFEAEKWIRNLKFDSLKELEIIKSIVYEERELTK